MSEFNAGDDPTSRQPIGDVRDLVAYIAAGAKPEADWRVGTEYEKVGVLKESGIAAPFSGDRGIENVLARLAERFGWKPKTERGRIIALTGRDGGEMAKKLAPGDFHLNVAHPRTMRVQEVHLLVVHCLCEVVDNVIFGEKK